jgi:hypothetical protein
MAIFNAQIYAHPKSLSNQNTQLIAQLAVGQGPRDRASLEGLLYRRSDTLFRSCGAALARGLALNMLSGMSNDTRIFIGSAWTTRALGICSYRNAEPINGSL